MPGWIRERDATSVRIDTPPPPGSGPSNLSRGSTSASKSKPSGNHKTTKNDSTQTSLKSHFAKLGPGDKTKATPAWLTALYSGKESSEERSETASHGGRESHSKRKHSPESNKSSKQQKKQRRDEETPAPSFNLMSVFGQPPQSSLAKQPRTPPRLIGITVGGKVKIVREVKPAPAISPSKRKSLVVDSARDVAVQQHRQSQRSSSPLQPIDNVAGQRRSVTPSRASTGLTPSKLRHGYSMIVFDDDLCPDTEETQADNGGLQEFEESEEQDAPSSPSEEKQERVASTPKLPYTLSPQSNKRIYAQETQPDTVSPIQRQQLLRGVGFTVTEREKEKKRSMLDDSQPLSTPPPTSPKTKETQLGTEDAQLRSSPTAAGGSFNADEDRGRLALVETYMSEEDEEEEPEQRRGCGDETFKLPSSEADYVTPVRPSEIKSKLRSSTKSPTKQSAVDSRHDEADDVSSETQPLPWDDEVLPAAAAAKNVSQRVTASWADVGKVWMEVDLAKEGEDKGGQAVGEQHQSSLHAFGFEASRRPKERKAVELNRDVEFDSDEGVESDTEDSEATQLLPWSDDDDDEAASASPTYSLLPSEGDLDSQTRLFLEAM